MGTKESNIQREVRSSLRGCRRAVCRIRRGFSRESLCSPGVLLQPQFPSATPTSALNRQDHLPAGLDADRREVLPRNHGHRRRLDRLRSGRPDGPLLRAVRRDRYLQAAASAALARSITTTATEPSPTSRRKPASAAKATTDKASRSATSTTMAIPICMSPATAAPSSITTMATARSPM